MSSSIVKIITISTTLRVAKLYINVFIIVLKLCNMLLLFIFHHPLTMTLSFPFLIFQLSTNINPITLPIFSSSMNHDHVVGVVQMF